MLPKDELRVSIISTCNMNCSYCHNEGNTQSSALSIDIIDKIVCDSLDLGLKSIRLTGGEPTLHPDFINICKLLKEKYGIKIGVNSNGINGQILENALNNKLIDRIVIGIDYFDNSISKESEKGVPSKKILDNIIHLKQINPNISISKVYVYDDDNTFKLVDWAINNDILIKIIELVTKKCYNEKNERYDSIRNKILQKYNLVYSLDNFNQVVGIREDNSIAVKFFHSHCRLGECDICKNIQLRITANGIIKSCIQTDINDIIINEKNIKENIKKILKM